jgi:FSR family fosmidomycin resistance protein-like MFS transporter
LAAFRSWSQTNIVTFLPKYYSDLGYSPSLFGLIAALFMGGSALGGVGGGWLADHYNKRAVVVWTLLLGVVPLALFPALGQTAWVYLLSPIAAPSQAPPTAS